jgi:hypothetical protein
MNQVGHANAAVTMDVYAQLEQRVDRRHGTAFDALLRKAKGRRANADWATRALRGTRTEPPGSHKRREKPAQARLSEVAETETRTRDTTIFRRRK